MKKRSMEHSSGRARLVAAAHRGLPPVLLLMMASPASMASTVLAADPDTGPDAEQPPYEAPTYNAGLDVVERRLELHAHRRLVATQAQAGARLIAFVSDGCSGGLSSAWSAAAEQLPAFLRQHGELPPWQACCVRHDVAYHAAVGLPQGQQTAAEASFAARKQADLALERCVAATAPGRSAELAQTYGLSSDEVILLYRSIAALMYRAVRLGGVPCSGLSWRWGYGWPACN